MTKRGPKVQGTGVCPACGKVGLTVNGTGRVWHHYDERLVEARWCPGGMATGVIRQRPFQREISC